MSAASIGFVQTDALATTLSAALAAVVPEPSHEISLTPAELRLLYWLATGRTNAQIAQCLVRSEKTVRNQLSQLYFKLRVGNRTEAVALYLRRGWGT